jgi:hypothetical protein
MEGCSMKQVQLSKTATAMARSKLLPEALDIQKLTRELRTMRDAGQSGSEVFDNLLNGFVSRRRDLVSNPINTPVDAFSQHTLSQFHGQARRIHCDEKNRTARADSEMTRGVDFVVGGYPETPKPEIAAGDSPKSLCGIPN